MRGTHACERVEQVLVILVAVELRRIEQKLAGKIVLRANSGVVAAVVIVDVGRRDVRQNEDLRRLDSV